MRTRALLLLCPLAVVPALGRAQTAAGTMTFTETNVAGGGGRNDKVINIAECTGNGDTLQLDWTMTTAWASTWSTYRLFATTASDCSSATTNLLAPDVAVSANSATGTVAGVDVRTKITAPLGVTCGGTPPSTIRLCASVYDTNAAAVGVTATMVVAFDFALPDPPIGVGTTPGDGALNVSWTGATSGAATATSFTATATAVAPAAGQTCNAGGASGGSCTVTGGTSCRIGGLTNFACYQVTVIGFSDSNNPSAASAAATGVPVPVDDFWKHYQDAGGREQGGCGLGGDGPLALLALLPLVARLRRRNP